VVPANRQQRPATTIGIVECEAGAMLDHVGSPGADLASGAFDDAVLAPLGTTRLMDLGVAIGFAGPPHPDISRFDSGDACHVAAVAAGAEVLHEPEVWAAHLPDDDGAFVRDPDGNNVDAVCDVPEPS
jgi:catechol 2,3-dioxygenase-like lactoylglutathione lyase family enzyme